MQSTDRLAAAERTLWERAGVTPIERRVTLRSGPTVRVQEVGEGPPVLFVHGGMNAGTSWSGLIGDLPGFRCLALDRPGCGLSEPAARKGDRWGIDDAKHHAGELVVEVLDALDIETAAVVATSLGGFFAFRGAAAHPERIERVVEFSYPIGAPMEKVPVSLRMSAIPGMGALMGRMPVTRGVVRMLLRQIGLRRALASGMFSDDMVEWFHLHLRDTPTMANELRSNPKAFAPIAGMNPEMLFSDASLAAITMPVLFVWGAEDPNGGEAVARPFAHRFPDATLEMLPLAGHAPWIDEPSRCAELTAEFLAARDGD